MSSRSGDRMKAKSRRSAASPRTRVRAKPTRAIPLLAKRGAARQLIVDGTPFLILGGELGNPSSSSLAHLAAVWPRLRRYGLRLVFLWFGSWKNSLTTFAAEAGDVRRGRWQPGRKMNGDDIVLNYRLAEQAEGNQSGSGLRFGSDGLTRQRVKLYRYHS